MTTPAKTNISPLEQIRNVTVYNDQVTAGASMETTLDSLEDNVGAIISQINRALNGTISGNNWYVDPPTPSTFEGGTVRGTISNNQDLHDLERKRILKRVSRIAVDVGVSTAATGTLTGTANFANTETVTIGSKTYTFQTTLTNVDGNVLIGGTLAGSLSNLQAAINLGAGSGTVYAAATTIHPTVYASSITSTTLVATAKSQGSAGNSIATTETAATASWGGATLSGGGATTTVIVLAPLQLPTSTTAAIGVVTTLGLVVASATTFGTADLNEVPGANALQPKNLWTLIDGATGEPVTRTGGVADGKQVWALAQSQSTTNASTITGISPNGLQMSLVVRNGTGDDLVLISAGDVPTTVSLDFAYVRRDAFEDCPEEAWLGDAFVDTGVSTTTRQAVYDNQGTAAVLTTTNATLNLGTGFLWRVQDAAGTPQPLFTVTEGSSGGTTNLTIGTDVDTYDNNAVDVDFNNGITVDNGSDPINIGVTVDQIDFTGNATITGTSGSSITVNAVAANASLTTTTSGNVVVTSAGLVDVNSTTTVTVDGTGISIDGTAASNFSVTGGELQLSTITSGELDLTSAGLMDVNAGANLDIDVTGTYDVLATGAGSIDFTGASNLSVASGNLTVSTTTTGNLILEGAVNVDVTSGTGDIDITAGTSVDITSGTTSDITATAGRNILLTSDVAEFDVSSQDVGHWLDRADFHYFGDTNRGDNYLTVNAQYVSSTGTTGGWVKVTSAATVTNSTISATVAGVAATSNPTITTSGVTGLAAGTIIIIEGASPKSLNGIYEVLSGAANPLTIRGVGTTDTVEDFTKRQIETDAAASGTLYTATVAVMRNSTTGVFQVATGSSTPLTFTNLSTGTSTLQQAYEAGNTILVSTAEGIVTLSNATDVTNLFEATRTFAGAGVAIDLNMGASTTGIGLDVDTSGSGNAVDINAAATASGIALNVAHAGTNDAVFVNNTGSGAALTVQDGGADVLDVSAAGAVTITPTSGTSATITVAGATGIVDINAGAGGVDIDVTGGPFTADATSFSIDATTASNVTTTAANLTLSTITSGTLAVTSAADVDVDGTVVTIDASSGGVSIDATGASNFTVTGGNLSLTTATSGDVIVNSVAAVDIDGTSITGDASTGAVSFQGFTDSDFQTVSTTTGTVTTTVNTTTSGTAGTAVTVNTAMATGTGATTATLNAYAATTSTTGTGTVNIQSNAAVAGASAVNINNLAGTGAATTNIANVTSTGANTVNIGNSSTSSLNTINIGNSGNSNTIQIGAGGTGPLDFDVGNTGSSAVITLTSGTAVSEATFRGWTATFPTKFVTTATNVDKNAATNAGIFTSQASYQSFENSTEGNLAVNYNTGYTAATATATFWVTVVAGSTATATTISAFTNNGAATNPTATTAAAATFTAGQFVLVTGGAQRENCGIYQVVTHVATTLTLAATPAAGAEFIHQQVTTTTGDTAAICLVTLSVMRVTTGGQFQIAENFSTTAGISYQDFGTGAVTLANAVTNQAGTAFTAGAFNTQWGIANNQFLEIGDASNNGILTISGDGAPTEAITGLGGTTTAGAGQGISFTTGAATTATENGGDLLIATGAGNTTGDSGNITIDTADANAVSGSQSGGVTISTGNPGDAVGSFSGSVSISSGGASPFFAVAGDSGTVSIASGNVFGTAVQSGAVSITSGSDAGIGGSGAAAGDISILGGSSNGASGDFGSGVGSIILLASSNSGTATAGGISITAGLNSGTGSAGTASLTGGAKTTSAGAGGTVTVSGGAGFTTGAGALATIRGGAGGATGVGGAVAVTGGAGGSTSGNAGGVTVAGGVPVSGTGGTVAITGSAGVGPAQAGGAVTVTAGNATTSAAAGGVTVTAGQSVTGTAGGVTITAGAGGSTSGTGGIASVTGGAGTASNSAGGAANVTGGAGQGSALGGNARLVAGAGGATGGGGAVSVTAGNGGATSGAAGAVAVSGGTPTDGNGGSVTITGTAGLGILRDGGSVTITSGAPTTTGAAGVVTIGNGSGSLIGQSSVVLTLDNNGSGTGGGEVMSVYTGIAAPTHTATTGSLALFDNATIGRLYVNESSGGSGTTWAQVQTATTTVTRAFFQDTFSTGVAAPGTITGAVLTGGVILVKPSAAFTFNTDAMVFLNGILLMNGATNEVSSGAGNAISLNAAGPSAVTGDVLTIIYATNSTSATA
jgi:hypothetical protein